MHTLQPHVPPDVLMTLDGTTSRDTNPNSVCGANEQAPMHATTANSARSDSDDANVRAKTAPVNKLQDSTMVVMRSPWNMLSESRTVGQQDRKSGVSQAGNRR